MPIWARSIFLRSMAISDGWGERRDGGKTCFRKKMREGGRILIRNRQLRQAVWPNLVTKQSAPSLDTGRVLVALEEVNQRIQLRPDPPSSLKVTACGDRFVELNRQLWKDVRGTPHCCLSTCGKAIEGQ